MSDERRAINEALQHALSGQGSHVATVTVFDGLDWKAAGARPRNAPHSVYQLLWHMAYWQEWGLKWLDGKRPTVPKHASGSWPDDPAPPGRQAWTSEVRRFRAGLKRLEKHAGDVDRLPKRGKLTGLGVVQSIASHNSYHAGEVALLRQMLGSWPPPSGGVTW